MVDNSEGGFWRVVDGTRQRSRKADFGERMNGHVDELRRALRREDIADVRAFTPQLVAAVNRAANVEGVAMAAEILADGVLTDDAFRDFCLWLVSLGRDTYEAALLDPNTLVTVLDDDDYFFEDFLYVAIHEYFRRTGKEDVDTGSTVELGRWGRQRWRRDELQAALPALWEAHEARRRMVPELDRGPDA